MEPHGSPSAGRPRPVDLAKTKVVVPMSKEEESDRRYFTRLMKQIEEEKEEEGEEESGKTTKERPLPHIVKYHDLLEKFWGWDRLLELGRHTVTLSVYTTYLEEYHRHNVHAATTDTSLSAAAETCLTNEEQLVSELMARVKPEQKSSLPMRRSIILSCLIQQRARSVIHPAGCKLSDVSGAALLCIAKEADLMRELLRLEAPIDNDLITQGTMIRLSAFSLMNCTRDNSVSASAVMLGMSKEAEMMCSWMHKNKKPIDFFVDPIPTEMWDCNVIWRSTLDFMANKLLKNSLVAEHKTVKEEHAAEHMTVKEEPAAEHMTVKEEPARSGPGGAGDNIAADEAANTTGGSQYKKGGEKSNKCKGDKNFSDEKSNKRKRKEEDVYGVGKG